MKEIREIVVAFENAVAAGKKTALATLVHVEGSSYRRPGARMLVTEDGELTGAISGGCLEGDALRKALLVMDEGRNKLVTYDTTDEDDAKLGIQLGCNGIVHILFEPINPLVENNPVGLLKQVTEKRTGAVVITLFSMHGSQQAGTCLLYSNGIMYNFLPAAFNDVLLEDVHASVVNKSSVIKQLSAGDNDLNAFIEFIAPPVSLVIAGAGNDAMPLVAMANILGWDIIVVDGRSSYANARRFPGAGKVLVAKPAEVLSRITVDAQTVFVLMTHNYNYDIALLRLLLPLPCQYVGLLGPKKKLERMLQEITAAGTTIEEDQLVKIFGPVGLNIGAETPEEIALSIIAEIKSVFAGRSGASLKYLDQPIHQRISRIIQHA